MQEVMVQATTFVGDATEGQLLVGCNNQRALHRMLKLEDLHSAQ